MSSSFKIRIWWLQSTDILLEKKCRIKVLWLILDMENIVKGANSDVFPLQVEKEEKKLVQQPERLSVELQYLKKIPCFRCGKTLTEWERNLYDHQTRCLNCVSSSNNPNKWYLTLQSFQFEGRGSLQDDFTQISLNYSKYELISLNHFYSNFEIYQT